MIMLYHLKFSILAKALLTTIQVQISIIKIWCNKLRSKQKSIYYIHDLFKDYDINISGLKSLNNFIIDWKYYHFSSIFWLY